MVRASVRFLLFTRRAAIIEIWSPPVEHDIEPKPLKSNNTSSLSLGSWSGHRVFILFLHSLPLPCLALMGAALKLTSKQTSALGMSLMS